MNCYHIERENDSMKNCKPTEKACMDAIHRLMQVKMLRRISVQEILDAAAISKATFYRHYKDKDDLFKKMICRDVNVIFTDNCNLNFWDVRILQFTESLRNEQKILQKLIRSEPYGFQTFYANILYELFLKRLHRLHNGKFVMTPDLHRHFLFMCSGVAAILQDWIMDSCFESTERIASEIVALLTQSSSNTPLSCSTLSM